MLQNKARVIKQVGREGGCECGLINMDKMMVVAVKMKVCNEADE